MVKVYNTSMYQLLQNNRYEFLFLFLLFLIEANPSVLAQSEEDYLKLGVEKFEVGDYRNAIRDFDNALSVNPNDTLAYKYRGLSHLILRSYRTSVRDFSKWIALAPQSAEAYFIRGLAKGKMEDFRGEIEDYNKAIKFDPTNIEAYFNRGAAKMQLEYYESAVIDFDKVIAMDPQHAAAFANRGQAKIASGEKQNGCDDLRVAGDMGFGGAFPVIIKHCH